MQTPCLLACLLVTGALAAPNPVERPNVVIIVADDLGYADCGVQGGRDIATPHLDALAASGIRFTQAYVTGPVCSPARAALLTGRHQLRDGVMDWIPPGKPGLDKAVPTLADYLCRAGYRTALIGKWHLGESGAYHPLARGFETFFGFLGGGRSYWPDPPAAETAPANAYTQLWRNRDPVTETEYLTTALGREAEAYVRRHARGSAPFFLLLSFSAVHDPMQAPAAYLERFAAIADPGRRAYAAMLASMDDEVGRVVRALSEEGVAERTLIVFLSDNGGPITRNAPNHSSNGDLRGGKGETWEGGIRVPLFMSWPERLPAGTVRDEPVLQMDLAVTALALAGASPDPAWPLDGRNLWPTLTEREALPPQTLFWHYGKQWAIREGEWKLTCAYVARRDATPYLGLYRLSADPGERHDLAAAQPERVRALTARWEAWRRSLGRDYPADAIHTDYTGLDRP